MAALGLVLHVGLLAWCVFGVWQNVIITGSSQGHGAHTYGGRWKYLTFLNQVLQLVFFGICVSCDLIQLCFSIRNPLCSFLTRLKNYAFATLVFPVGVFVVTSFWSLYVYDRELVYPKVLDSIIPEWLNHTMHTVILPLVLIEVFAYSHQYPGRKSGLGLLALFASVYLSWVLWVHHAADIWVYPILAKLDPVGMTVFFVASFLVMVPFYYIGEFLTHWRWGSGRPSKRRRKKKN
ncbi:androgen-dependent TFPI-regulating protein-like [Aquarana catesbeiana]|uniref:androgen-dependent TFPI-regulating protein-like n=1 Tax=Aquarana catesbeiana TaxID=8400 RepID=UPI003CCA3307